MTGGRGPRVYLAALVSVLAVFAASTLAAAEKPVIPEAFGPEAVFSGDFWPKALSKKKPTPIRLDFSARFSTTEERLPALRELLLRGDKRLDIDVDGIPTAEDVPGCTPNSGPRRGIGAIRKTCKPLVVGGGRIRVRVQFPGQAPIPVGSEVLVLNGGVKGGVTTLYIHTYLTAPVTALVVTTMKIKKIDKGRYGLEAIAAFPKIAGGSGSITFFTLTLEKRIVSATCPDGRLAVNDTAVFSDGTLLTGAVIRTCTPRS